MAIATGTALIIAAAAAAAGTAYTTYSQYQASEYASEVADKQAETQVKQLELRAQAEKTEAEVAELGRQRTLDRIISAQNAVFGATGLATTSGSFTGIQTTDVGRAAESSRLNQLFTDTRQVGFKSQIRGVQSQAAVSRQASRISRRTNLIKGGTSLINIGGSYYENKLN